MIYIIIDVIVFVEVHNNGVVEIINVYVLMGIIGIIKHVDNAQQVHNQPQINQHVNV